MGSSPPSRLPTDGEATTVESLMPATAARPPLTATACTTSTTPSWSSDTDPTTGSSRTPGEPAGERTDTSGSSVDLDTAELDPSTRPSPTADRDHAQWNFITFNKDANKNFN